MAILKQLKSFNALNALKIYFGLSVNFFCLYGSLQFRKKPDVIISDWHIGTTMWQAAVLKKLGLLVEAYSLSGHQRYVLDDPTFCVDPLFTNLGSWDSKKIKEEFEKKCHWSHLKKAICSFPPAYVTTLEKLPSQVSLLLNVGHRIHICTSPTDFTKLLIKMKQDSRYTIATMSEYDFHYIRYYTGLESMRLPVICQHIPKKLRDAAYDPSSRIVLVGPSHNTTRIIGFNDDLDYLNRLSASFAARHGLEPYTFRFIKSVYPNDQASMENLSKHPAVLINPYSVFSISMVELYQLNIPFFVPDDSLLVGIMNDVRLYPIYHSKEVVDRLEIEYPVMSSGYPYSPNDESVEAQLYWMKYMFFNQVRHAQHWVSPDDLFQKLYLNDLRKIHDDMQDENTQLFSEQLKVWTDLFGKM